MTKLKKRNVLKALLLSFVTCGIYTLFWEWDLIVGLAEEGEPTQISGTIQYLLTFVGISSYSIGYLMFGCLANGEYNNVLRKYGKAAEDNMFLFVLLGIICPIALLAVVQHKVNSLFAD